MVICYQIIRYPIGPRSHLEEMPKIGNSKAEDHQAHLFIDGKEHHHQSYSFLGIFGITNFTHFSFCMPKVGHGLQSNFIDQKSKFKNKIARSLAEINFQYSPTLPLLWIHHD